MDIFTKNPKTRKHLITNHGLLPLIGMLTVQNVAILHAILRLVTQIIESNEILVNVCVMGIIPAIMTFGDSSNALLTRLYAAYFVQRAISSTETLQMFVACRGLSLLVGFLEPDYIKNKELIHIAIDCIASIFKLQNQTPTPKNEYFHLFVQCGLLERLSTCLVSILKVPNVGQSKDVERNYIEKTSKIFKVFSLGDSDVKLRICNNDVLPNLKQALKLMDPNSKEVLSMLHMIRDISFDRLTLNHLASMIIPLLEIVNPLVQKNEFVKEIFYQVTHSLFHLCRLNRSRQEVAVKAGLITCLLFVIQNNKPLKEFAVPMMCELAKSSSITRATLLEKEGLNFYLELLDEPKGTFHTDALDAIAICLDNERAKVEPILLKEKHLFLMKEIFVNVGDHNLVNLLDSMLSILVSSSAINTTLGADNKETGFVAILKNKLHHRNPHARVRLLRALNTMCSKYQDPQHFLKHNNLLKIVRFMASRDSSLLVKNMAVHLLKEGGRG